MLLSLPAVKIQGSLTCLFLPVVLTMTVTRTRMMEKFGRSISPVPVLLHRARTPTNTPTFTPSSLPPRPSHPPQPIHLVQHQRLRLQILRPPLYNNSTFTDVPSTHPYYNDIEILYANGLTAGCSTNPLKFCPDQTMNRGEAAVFMLRGNFGSGFVPDPPKHIFKDDWSKGTWAEPWAEAMYFKGLSAGCSSSPLKYCPWDQIPREQAVIFALRLKVREHLHPSTGHRHLVCRHDESQPTMPPLDGAGLQRWADPGLRDERGQAEDLSEGAGEPWVGRLYDCQGEESYNAVVYRNLTLRVFNGPCLRKVTRFLRVSQMLLMCHKQVGY